MAGVVPRAFISRPTDASLIDRPTGGLAAGLKVGPLRPDLFAESRSKGSEAARREYTAAGPLVGRAGAMATDISFSRSDQSQILSRLRTLRTSLAHARDALLHFKDDRLDRDKLEPAARRVDDLMNMFVSTSSDRARVSAWICEIQIGVELVTNPKAAEALSAARVDISALLDIMSLDPKAPRAGINWPA
jgi:hypothetical protein